MEGDHRRLLEDDLRPALAGQRHGGDHARRDQQRQPGEDGGCRGVRVAAEQCPHPGVTAQHLGQPLLAELPDRVHVRQVQGDRRVVEGDQRRTVRRALGQRAVQPAEGLLVEQAVVSARDRGVEHQHIGTGQRVQPVHRAAGRLLAEQHLAVGLAGVVVAGAEQHRVPGGQHLGHLPVLGRQSVVGEVAGDQHGVHRAGQGVHVRHHLLGPPAGPLPRVAVVVLAQVDVTEVNDRQHAVHRRPIRTWREPPPGA